MKKTLSTCLRRLVLSAALLMISLGAYANHIIGMDMTYAWVSGSTYTITLSVYGDCGDVTGAFPLLATATPQVAVFNGGTYVTCLTLAVNSPSAGVFSAPVCAADTNLTTCTSLAYTIPGIKKFTYSTTYTFTGTSHYWRFVFLGSMGTASFAGRQATITNITGASTSVICLVDTLDNTWHNNTSPTLFTSPTPFYCLNNPNNYNPNGVDPDGDSLSYFLAPGEVGNYPVMICNVIPGTFVGYTGTAWPGQPVTDTTPLQVNTGAFSFSHSSGDLSFTPNLAQRSLVVYNIDEYRNDTFIGNSQREMVFLVQTCTVSPPTGVITAATGAGLATDSVNYTICQNTGPFSFHINPTSTAPGLQIYVSATGIPAGASFTITGDSTSSPTCTFSWTSTGVPIGTYTFYVTLQDNNCPISGTQTVAYTVVVTGSPTVAASAPVCAGSTRTLTPTPVGGIWSSGSPSIATIGSGTGTVGGVLPGTSLITYSLGSGCNVTTVVTVNPVPANITGPTVVCPGSTIALGDVTGGGTWSSSSLAAATVTGAGVVTGVAPGTTTITYTVGGCSVTSVITVISLPPPISGSLNVCQFAITPLTDPGGGTWSSSNTGVATVGTSGAVTGVTPGTSTITYSIGTGCNATAIVTVNPAPLPISGTMHVCATLTTTLTDLTPGGTWGSSNPSIASVVSGVVTGGDVLATNTALITYTAPGGCFITTTVTVNPTPTPILGPVSVCSGQTILLSDPGSGTWSSSATAIATVGSVTGIVGGVAAAGGSVTITYTLPTGCNTTYLISVSPLPSAITGIAAVCEDAGTTTLSDPTAGGYWTSNNTTLATIDPFSGIVTGSGVTTGVDTILYNAGCSAAIAVTVNPAPPVITGAGTVCMGSATTLSDAVTGGTWSSSISSIASVGSLSGIVTGGVVTTPASVTITYTAPSGCNTSITMIVYPPPAAITGTMHLCAGQSTILADASGGGTWTSSNTVVAVVTPGPTSGGIVTGNAPGTDTVTYYSPGTGCTRTAVVTVNAAPVAISGIPSVCIGSTITLSDATPGGTWSSSNTAIATAGSATGVIGGVAATPAPGTTTITYSTGGACVATIVVTVHALPAAILGSLNVCAGASVTLSDAAGAGLWTSSVDTVATITPTTGTVSSLLAGTTTITYTPATGCSRTATLTVSALPPVCIVSGGGGYCSGSPASAPHVTLSCSTAGVIYRLFNGTTAVGGTVTGTGSPLDFGPETGAGTYTVTATNAAGCTVTMSGTAVVSISPLPTAFTVTLGGSGTYCAGGTGADVKLSGSTTGINYQLFNGAAAVGSSVPGTGGALDFGLLPAGVYTVVATNPVTTCTRTMTGSATVTASPLPVITGPTAVCVAATIAEAAVGFTGVTWTSSLVTTATVGLTTGFVTGVATGTTTITATSTAGCTATTVVTVTLSPTGITGANTVCVGATTTESDGVSGGLWTITPTSIGTVGSLSGIVTGVNPGPVTLTYSLGGSGCTVTKTMTVTPAPASISGSASLCGGATTSLGDATGGGTWGTSDIAVASVTGTGSVTGGISGTATITYTLGGCTSTLTVTVNPAPAIITGPSTVCAGSEITLLDATGGGSWTSSNTAVATVDGSGDVWGVAPGGTATITYSLGGSCTANKIITVNPISAITGSTGLCVETTTILSDATAGGTWAIGSTAVATLSGSGSSITVNGAGPGSSVITYTTAAGCTATTTVNVSTAPTPIGGTLHVCVGSCTPLTDGAPGGSWSSSNTLALTIDPTTGIACGVAPGISTVTYSLGSGCTKTAVVTVNGLPAAITGIMHVCLGSTTTLSDVTTGGTWSSSNLTVAAVNPFTGTVTGNNPGTSTITYLAATGCTATTTVTVNLPPPAITGNTSICVGSTTALSDATGGGNWSSSNTAVATIGSSTGIAGGVEPGVTTITYSLGTGCGASMILTVLPPPPAITGGSVVCVGQSAALEDSTTGGTWSTGPATIAVINSTTGVLTGVSSGTVIVSYSVGTGCGVISSVIINALSPITGSSTVCAGQSVILTDTTGGGAWSSSNTAVATAMTTGLNTGEIWGAAAGTATILYTLPSGCAASYIVTVNPAPPAISGTLSVCFGSTTTLSDATGGGAWSSSNTTVALVSATGVVTGSGVGTSIITYRLPGTGCPAIAEVTVNSLPPAISGPTEVCLGTTVNYTDGPAGISGTWSSSSTGVATIDSVTGILTGITPGPATVIFTIGSGCTASEAINVSAPPAAITGPIAVVCPGDTIRLSDATPGGDWSSSNTGVAITDPAGDVIGTGGGEAIISYTTGAGCSAILIVTVHPVPGGILGTTTLCQGTTTILEDATAGGTWMSSDGTVATISSPGGNLTATWPGSATITFTAPTGCTVTATVIVNAAPGAITGSPAICLTLTTALTDTTLGGVWSSTNSTVAPVDPTGVVTGLAAGTSIISYTAAGCAATLEVTVNAAPGTISGIPVVCVGSTTLLGDTPPGGSWSSSDPTTAAVDIATGNVTGIAPGTADITYSVGVGCTTDQVVTVNPVPLPIGGPAALCAGGSATLSDITGGGSWSSTSPGVAFVASPAAGVYMGITAGTATISYTIGTGCAATQVVTVNPVPEPIGGNPQICLGSTTTLTDGVSGGLWSSSLPAIASVPIPAAGVVEGNTLGSATIYYTLGTCPVNITVMVLPLPTAYTVTGGGSYCAGGAGADISLSGSGVGVNYLLYHGVTATGTFSGTGAPLDFGLQAVAGPYTVIAVSTATGCSNIMSGSVTVVITPNTAPSVSISTGVGSTVCSGTSTTFTATPVFGGSTPVYVWNVDGTDVGTGSAYTFVPANGDVVQVTLTSDATCVLPATASSEVTMRVLSQELPVAGISLTPGDTVCQGSAVTLSATPLFGGTAPAYTWIKNGGTVSTAAAYTYLPISGDTIYLSMTSNYLCRLENTVLSNKVTMMVDTPSLPMVSINAKPGTSVAIGQFDTLTAVVAGSGALSYQWVVNEVPVAGATSNTFISNNFSFPTQDSVTCVVTSDGTCSATSFGWVYVTLYPEGVKAVTGSSDITVLPNPNKGEFTIKGTLGGNTDEEVWLELTDMLGQQVYKTQVTAQGGSINERVHLDNLANGMYLLNVISGSGNRVFHIVIEQ